MDKITSSTVMPPTTLLPVDPKRSPAILVRLLLNRTWSTLSSRLRTMNRYRSKKFTFRATNVNLLHLMLIRRILIWEYLAGDHCGMPDGLRNGTARYVSHRNARYECNRGFVIRGKGEIFCRNGKWSSMPTCEIMPPTPKPDSTAMAKNQISGLVKAVKSGGSVPTTTSPSVISGIVFIWFIILTQ